jgi:hypothetical protein
MDPQQKIYILLGQNDLLIKQNEILIKQNKILFEQNKKYINYLFMEKE